MANLSDPNPIRCEITIRTPLVGQYMRRLAELTAMETRKFSLMYLDSFRAQEAEFGRGVILVINSGPSMAPRHAARIVAKVEELFDDRERAFLAREGEIAVRTAIDDAGGGI